MPVIVNLGGYFIGEQRLREERDRLRTDLIEDAKRLDQEITDRWNTAMTQMTARTEEIGSQAALAHEYALRLWAERAVTRAIDLAQHGSYLMAAYNHALAAMPYTRGHLTWWVDVLIPEIVDWLGKVEPTGRLLPKAQLDAISSNLQFVAAAEGVDEETRASIRAALSRVEELRGQPERQG